VEKYKEEEEEEAEEAEDACLCTMWTTRRANMKINKKNTKRDANSARWL